MKNQEKTDRAPTPSHPLMIRVKILRLRAGITWNRARLLTVRARMRVSLLVRVLRLAPKVTYISRNPMFHPMLLRMLAEELGEEPDRFIKRCWRETTTVQKEIGDFEDHAKRLGFVATTRHTLEIRVDYDPPPDRDRLRREKRRAKREAPAVYGYGRRDG